MRYWAMGCYVLGLVGMIIGIIRSDDAAIIMGILMFMVLNMQWL